jgi:hypothetical protein
MTPQNQNNPRPPGVVILTGYTLFLVQWNIIRMGNAIFFWDSLKNYGSFPVYISISGGIWCAAGLLISGGLWKGIPVVWNISYFASAGYFLWYWIDRLFIENPNQNWLFVVFLSSIIFFIYIFILSSRKTRTYFQIGINK